MRKTKIVCTLGPASEDEKVIKQLVEKGMNVARLNFSHGVHKEHRKRIDLVKKVSLELRKPIGIMLDTKGPEIRTGKIKKDKLILQKGHKIRICSKNIVGDENKITIDYNKLIEDLKPGSIILIDDGLIELEVLELDENELICKIKNGGELSSKKGVNLPGINVQLPAITEKDIEDIIFGLNNGIHFIAASFTRKAADLIEIRKLLEENRAEHINIIAKIENQQGVDNIDEIIEVADGIMVARGDLGVEIPAQKVPVTQKMIIKKCNEQAIPVITATQMLDSMIRNPRPTRAEATDVANAIFDGTDATMLSGETAAGEYPVSSVEMMARIAEEAETSLFYRDRLLAYKTSAKHSVTEAISYASCETATDLGAEAIITATGSGLTARMVSKNRPFTQIIAVTPDSFVQHSLALSWGVYPLLVPASKTTDEMIENAISIALENKLIKNGDLVTITAGAPVGIPGTTNLIKVDVVGKPVIEGQGIGKGIVLGKIKIALNYEEAIDKIEKGDILLTAMTDREFMPALEKAAAIITMEGGLTSHPAIVGLNLGMPVVVNTGDILDKVEDGELVTVDGVRGLVYRGQAHIK